MKFKKINFTSVINEKFKIKLYSPCKYRELETLYSKNINPSGSKNSYYPSYLNNKKESFTTKNFNRILTYDKKRQIIEVESGVQIKQILDWALPKNLILSITPGLSSITIGGAISADIHGKNPYKEKTFGSIVMEMEVFIPNKGVLICNKNLNKEIYYNVIGGFGIFGLILTAKLKLQKFKENCFIQKTIPFTKFKEIPKLLDTYKNYDVLYSWHSTNYKNNKINKNLLFIGKKIKLKKRHVSDDELNKNRNINRNKLLIKFPFWNYTTTAIANFIFYHLHKKDNSINSVYKTLFPYENFQFVRSLYGRKKFTEIQILINKRKIYNFLDLFEIELKNCLFPLFFISLKKFSGKNLSLGLTGRGYLVTLSFYKKINEDSIFILKKLIVTCSAQIYLAKCFPFKKIEDIGIKKHNLLNCNNKILKNSILNKVLF